MADCVTGYFGKVPAAIVPVPRCSGDGRVEMKMLALEYFGECRTVGSFEMGSSRKMCYFKSILFFV